MIKKCFFLHICLFSLKGDENLKVGDLVYAKRKNRRDYAIAKIIAIDGDMVTVIFRGQDDRVVCPRNTLRPTSMVRDVDVTSGTQEPDKVLKVHRRGVRLWTRDEIDRLTPETIAADSKIINAIECPKCGNFFRDFPEHMVRHGISLSEYVNPNFSDDYTVPDLVSSYQGPRRKMAQVSRNRRPNTRRKLACNEGASTSTAPVPSQKRYRCNEGASTSTAVDSPSKRHKMDENIFRDAMRKAIESFFIDRQRPTSSEEDFVPKSIPKTTYDRTSCEKGKRVRFKVKPNLKKYLRSIRVSIEKSRANRKADDDPEDNYFMVRRCDAIDEAKKRHPVAIALKEMLPDRPIDWVPEWDIGPRLPLRYYRFWDCETEFDQEEIDQRPENYVPEPDEIDYNSDCDSFEEAEVELGPDDPDEVVEPDEAMNLSKPLRMDRPQKDNKRH